MKRTKIFKDFEVTELLQIFIKSCENRKVEENNESYVTIISS